MPQYVPQGYNPPQGQVPAWRPPPRRPFVPQPDPRPDVDEPESRNEPPLAPSGPENESEADIIPARPDDGSGGGPTSATPNRPPMFFPGGRIEKDRVPVRRSRSVDSAGLPPLLPGSLSQTPLVPPGMSLMYFDEIHHHSVPVAKDATDEQMPVADDSKTAVAVAAADASSDGQRKEALVRRVRQVVEVPQVQQGQADAPVVPENELEEDLRQADAPAQEQVPQVPQQQETKIPGE